MTDYYSHHDQSASSSLLVIKPNQNLIIELNPFVYDHWMLKVVECLKYSPLVLALSQMEFVIMSLLSEVYSSASYEKNKDRIYFQILNRKTSLSKVRLCSLLGIAVDASVISPGFLNHTTFCHVL